MKRVVLTGNGLSVALNTDFSLQTITERFFDRLDDSHSDFIKHHMKNNYNQLDFEEAIASIEQAYDSLKHYNDFLNEENGKNFMTAYKVSNEYFAEHLEAMQNIIYEYTASILDLIDGNVKKDEIDNKLEGFVEWLKDIIDSSDEIDLFTLNFDLLLETILLTYYRSEQFADFHYRGKKWNLIGNEYQFYFGPDRSREFHPENYRNNIRLHHLHGSLSSFKNLDNGRLFKITTESLRENDVYKRIFDMNIIPSIVTGGGKSLKVQQEPFSFYYNEFKKKMVIEAEMCDELYIIGYSFRDDHINKAIAERYKNSRKKNGKQLRVCIIDFANNEQAKKEFVDRVNQALGITSKSGFKYDDERILFGGANAAVDLLASHS